MSINKINDRQNFCPSEDEKLHYYDTENNDINEF